MNIEKLKTHLAELGCASFPSSVRYAATTGSTNDDAIAAAAQGSGAGTVFLADRQTKGRGRHGGEWISQPGENLLMSVLIGRSAARWGLHAIGLSAAAAVRDSLADIGLHPRIKWPNDIIASGRKIAGLLIESAGDDLFTLGIGVNLNQQDFFGVFFGIYPPGSVRSLSGNEVDREEYAARLLFHLDRWLSKLDVSAKACVDYFMEHSCSVGHSVIVRTPSQELTGEFLRLHYDGNVVVFSREEGEVTVPGAQVSHT